MTAWRKAAWSSEVGASGRGACMGVTNAGAAGGATARPVHAGLVGLTTRPPGRTTWRPGKVVTGMSCDFSRRGAGDRQCGHPSRERHHLSRQRHHPARQPPPAPRRRAELRQRRDCNGTRRQFRCAWRRSSAHATNHAAHVARSLHTSRRMLHTTRLGLARRPQRDNDAPLAAYAVPIAVHAARGETTPRRRLQAGTFPRRGRLLRS